LGGSQGRETATADGGFDAVYCEGSVCDLVPPERLSGDELLALDVDLLVPAALENAITAANVDQVRARVILELANGPISSTADQALYERGVTVIPDVLANAGGVMVSYFEWVQNRAGLYWTADEVRTRLRDRMVTEAERLWAFRQRASHLPSHRRLRSGAQPHQRSRRCQRQQRALHRALTRAASMNTNRAGRFVSRLRRPVTTPPHESQTAEHRRVRLMFRAMRILVAAIAVAGVTGTAGANPGSGTQSVVLAQGTMPEPFTLYRTEASEVIFQQVTIQPGGHTGWHSHPGKLIAVVKSGTFTRYLADCTFQTYTQGESFIEPTRSTWAVTTTLQCPSSCTSLTSTRWAAPCG
jgi:quercetin dioxygenase-like cupin family protein